MIYLLTTVVFILGVFLHIMIKITSYKKTFPTLSFGAIWATFFKEEWDSLLVSLVILVLVEVTIYIINYVGIEVPIWMDWGIYLIALVMGYQGQRLAYKFLNTAGEKSRGNKVINNKKPKLMSHKAQRIFCKRVRELFPDSFRKKNVIDVGSLDINGNNRYLFKRCYYVGVDIVNGENVDVVGKAHLVLPTLKPKLETNYVWNPYLTRIQKSENFDTIISTEALEHDEHWGQTLRAMFYGLKCGGLLVITAGGDGREEHGTHNHTPLASPGTNDYYKNISNEMFSTVLPPHLFKTYYLNQASATNDFQFYGIKY
jgi:hypothetical protein